MASLQVHEHPFLESAVYPPRVELTLTERIAELNSRIYYSNGEKIIDWNATDAWRQEGIRELPHPPAGYKYAFQEHKIHLVVRGVNEEYQHERRKVTGKIDLEYDSGAHVRLHLAEKAAAKRAMQEAIRATEVQLARARRKKH